MNFDASSDETVGSVANIPGLPTAVKDLYRTVWEIDPKIMIDMAAERAPYIDQSESLSLYVASPQWVMLVSAVFAVCWYRRSWCARDSQKELYLYGWQRGLKTGVYYLRSRAPTFPTPYAVPSSSFGPVQRAVQRPGVFPSSAVALPRVDAPSASSVSQPIVEHTAFQFGSIGVGGSGVVSDDNRVSY